ncbi:hypothetical protein D1871_22810 [Nakamurella silvestris]|nr:hypothetical protein D1871_22810 [Nakamurella silvestris]
MPDYSRTRTISHSSANLFQLLTRSGDLQRYLPDLLLRHADVPEPGTDSFHHALGSAGLIPADPASGSGDRVPPPVTNLAPPTAGGPPTAVIDGPADTRVSGKIWFTVFADDHRIEWGHEGDDDSHGELQVDPVGCGAYVTMHLHVRGARPGMDRIIDEALDRVAELAS